MMPKRLQLRRVKGWRKPPGSVVCGRPSIYSNPFPASKFGSAEEAVGLYALYFNARWRELEATLAIHLPSKEILGMMPGLIIQQASLVKSLPALSGRDLLCWCKAGAIYCHANIILAAVNSSEFLERFREEITRFKAVQS